ncbi:MAG: ATP-dependent zinc metalloprotease FtsH [Candidatus Aerophobetes bacterium]|nr:ATP-dependent zinc metalloprotease FtsH [Candidatus Aerophobetes bacterium]
MKDRENQGRKKNQNFFRRNKFGGNLLLLLIIFIIVISFFNFIHLGPAARETELSYTQFLGMVENRQIRRVVIKEDLISGKIDETTSFRTVVPNDPELIKILRENGVEIEVRQESSPWITNLLGTLLPILIFIGIWVYIIKRMSRGGGQVFSFGKSRAKLASKEKVKVTFKDVAGVEEAKEELKEIIDFLKNPQKFQRLGAKIPKGVLLVGPPGCGKTLLAKAVAGEAGVPFFSISGSDFVEMFVGVGASRVRDLFEQGKRNAPCIIFIDELDAVGRQRFAGIGGGHDEKEQTLNQLLTELDGFDTREGVIIIGATNRPDVLDSALLRPGRFDRRITVNIPDLKEREEILALYVRDKPVTDEVDVKVLARRTPGFVGSDIENLVNEASLLAARKNKGKIGMEEFEEAIDRVIAGPERKSRVMRKKEKRIIAYHESGHTLVANHLPFADPIHKVSVIPRGSVALGYTLQLPLEDKYLATKSELMDKIIVLLAGRASEEIMFKEVSSGAQNDLEQATHLVRKMICDYGMSDKLGPVTLGGGNNNVFLGRDFLKEKNYSEELAFDIDKEIHRITQDCYDRALKILRENKDKLIELAELLEKKEILVKEEIEKILGKKVIKEDSSSKLKKGD